MTKPSKGRLVELPNATPEQRKAIGRVVNAIKAARVTSFREIYVEALGSLEGYGLEDEKNLGKGSIAQWKAAKLFRWIVETHLPIGCQVAPEVFDPSLLTRWRDFVQTHGVYGKLTHRLLGGMGLTERSSRQPIARPTIAMDQEFVFDLECGVEGKLLALEGAGGHTYPLSLYPDHVSLLIDVRAGSHSLPTTADGELDPLREKDDPGLRSYLFLIGQPQLIESCIKGLLVAHPIGLDKLDQIALAFTETDDHDPGPFELHRLNVIFTRS